MLETEELARQSIVQTEPRSPHRLQVAALVAEVVAAVALVVSLIFVSLQLAKNTQELAGATAYNLLALDNQNRSWLRDPEFLDIVARAEQDGESLSDLEFRQFSEWMNSVFNVCEHVFYRHKSGLIDEDLWQGWSKGCGAYLEINVGSRQVWAQRKQWFGPEFVAWYDGFLAEDTDQASGRD